MATEITFTDMDVFITFALMMYFLWLGYQSEKRSGGAFMLFAGLILLYLEAVIADYVSALLVIGLISPIAIFIILLGILKLLYKDTKKKE